MPPCGLWAAIRCCRRCGRSARARAVQPLGLTTIRLDERPRPHGAVADRASSTSAASTRSCSTGSSRAGRGASACCGSRTPTRAARSWRRRSRSSARSRWLGIDWDGPVTFQLDAMERCRELAARLVEEDKAYEDEGAIRFRMPDEGVTGWEDAVRGRIEFPNEQLEDVVIVRSDGRPTYNFASPVEDMDDGDHARDPRRRPHLEHAEAAPDPRARSGTSRRSTRTSPAFSARTGKKLSKRHGAVSVDEFRERGTCPTRSVNFLALIGWAPDGETTIMSPRRDRRAVQARGGERRAPARSTTQSSTG